MEAAPTSHPLQAVIDYAKSKDAEWSAEATERKRVETERAKACADKILAYANAHPDKWIPVTTAYVDWNWRKRVLFTFDYYDATDGHDTEFVDLLASGNQRFMEAVRLQLQTAAPNVDVGFRKTTIELWLTIPTGRKE